VPGAAEVMRKNKARTVGIEKRMSLVHSVARSMDNLSEKREMSEKIEVFM
jgi:hypothetical protein